MASYTKLQSGDWGVRVSGTAPAVGATVTVTKRDGTAKVEIVDRVLWAGTGRDGQPAALCSIRATPRPSTDRRRRNEDEECEVCGRNKYTCGHCVGW
jgi:hypothetical protein